MKFARIIGMATAVIFGLAANAAMAQGGYGSLSYFDWEMEQTDFPRLSSAGVRAVGGYMFDERLGLEAHIATGGTEDIVYQVTPTASESAEAELNKLLGIFARGNVSLAGRLNAYGLFGYSYGRVEIVGESTKTMQSHSSFGWGAGVEVALSPGRLYLVLEHTEYLSDRDLDAEATSLGLRLSFTAR